MCVNAQLSVPTPRCDGMTIKIMGLLLAGELITGYPVASAPRPSGGARPRQRGGRPRGGARPRRVTQCRRPHGLDPHAGLGSAADMSSASLPAVARPRQRGGHVRRPQGPTVARALGKRRGPAVARSGHVRRPYGPAVARDLGSAADMFVGPTRGELRDMFARLNDRPAGDVMQAARHVRSCARACLVPGATSS